VIFWQAHEELQTLSVNIVKQRYVAQQETERLILEQTKLRQLTSQLEAEHAKASLKQLHLRQISEMEQTRLDLERNRQMTEWSELEKERQHQLVLRQTDLQCAQQHLVNISNWLTVHSTTEGKYFKLSWVPFYIFKIEQSFHLIVFMLEMNHCFWSTSIHSWVCSVMALC